MVADQNPLHPELRRASKIAPRLSFNRRTLWLFRLLSNFQPKGKTPAGIQVEQVYIPSQDPGHRIRLRIYKPRASVSPAPVLVWMHGGGLIIGKPEQDEPFLFQFALELGIRIVSIDYRLAPDHPFPTPLDDGYAALKWVRAQGQTMGMDPNRIAVGGGSAGGGLAAALVQLAHDRGEVQPVFQMLVYPMLDDRSSIRPSPARKDLLTWSQESNRFGWESYLNQKCGADAVPPYAVPARRADLAGLPPAWIGVGTLDLFYEEDVAYANALKACGVDCELVVVPGAFHGFDFFGEKLKIVADFRMSQIEALKKYLYQ